MSTILLPSTLGFSEDETLTFFPNAILFLRDTSVPSTVIVLEAIADVIYSSFTAIALTVAVLDTANTPS